MKKIKNLFYKALSLIFTILSTNQYLYPQSILGGSLQFAKYATLDDISICHCGKTISTQKHQVAIPKITYEIPKAKDQKEFYILITTTTPTYDLKSFPKQEECQNTVAYLKVDPTSDYLFYNLVLVEDEHKQINTQPQTYHWVITKSTLPSTGKLPDTTVIITYFPNFIKDIKGGNHLELPTIYIDNSTITSFGSEENFEDALIRLQLSSLDLNALHAPTKRKMKSESRRLLIMDTLT